MEKRELICIGCPLGCPLTVTMEENGITVTGNTCKRGEIYAKKEVTNPTRVVTSSVHVNDGVIPMVSVKTKEDIPKDKIFACMEEIRRVFVAAPVHIGDIVIEDCAGTGVPVIATKNVERA
ncbi:MULTISPECIES: DUF1667 domain-containing protein [unclassified Clostridium]|uniref:DUF1667 domain-containing protein n=1 Tax=unclassified Clostridium TaxID=2614128 RepID=UPI000E54D2BE|nr:MULTISPECIES: DUF1667 domain-containing protein [unclassified Clostridium]RHP41937.1 DUF1667 domain-containing protein [Clostridium sp. AF32-12BH]RHV62792.1 DUF1667 domain-containing protein [Clostridium sp. OM02-18AC]